jgi:hypothetical protein
MAAFSMARSAYIRLSFAFSTSSSRSRFHVGHRGGPVLAPPFQERGLADAVLPKQIRHRHAALRVLQDADNLGLAELPPRPPLSSGDRGNQLDFPAASTTSPRPNPPWRSAPPSPSNSRMAASSAAGLRGMSSAESSSGLGVRPVPESLSPAPHASPGGRLRESPTSGTAGRGPRGSAQPGPLR